MPTIESWVGFPLKNELHMLIKNVIIIILIIRHVGPLSTLFTSISMSFVFECISSFLSIELFDNRFSLLSCLDLLVLS